MSNAADDLIMSYASIKLRFSKKALFVMWRIWTCQVCGFQYNERLGLPEEGIPPGTRWEDIPDDWVCPDCGMEKSAFDMVAEEEGDNL